MNIAVILAGGTGTRMRDDGFPKQYLEVNGKPVLVYTLEKFQSCEIVDRIIVVADSQWEARIHSWAAHYGITKLCAVAAPGQTRQESVFSGLLACEPYISGQEDYVLIHDAARPLVTPELICTSVKSTYGHDGCLPVISIKDTVYYSLDGHSITGQADRSTLFCGQCPEVFRLSAFLALNKRTPPDVLKKIRGCCELAFQNDMDIVMIPGDEDNFKLTTATDLRRFTDLVNEEK